MVAALLHDTLEDTDTTPDVIEAHFGKEILRLVQASSEDKEKSWEERKAHTIGFMKTAPEDVKMLCLPISFPTCAASLWTTPNWERGSGIVFIGEKTGKNGIIKESSTRCLR